MTSEALRIELDLGGESHVAAVLDRPEGESREAAILLAHGAGAPLDSTFMRFVAAGLCDRGFPVLRFHYPYMERRVREGRTRPPDRAPVLEAAHARAAQFLRARYPGHRLILGGKSLGARMASHLAAKGEDCAGLFFLGYPLHPPGRPERQRKEHFPAIVHPTLFLQGTRDALCDLGLLEEALRTFGGVATLRVVEGGNHSFELMKRAERTTEEAWEELCDQVDAWARAHFGV